MTYRTVNIRDKQNTNCDMKFVFVIYIKLYRSLLDTCVCLSGKNLLDNIFILFLNNHRQ
jgi:hypothetical protein